jgi:MFS family permease
MTGSNHQNHRARIAIGTLFLVNGFAFATWVSRIPAVQQSLDLSAGVLGAALAGLGIGSFLTMPATGWLIARCGSRPVTSAASVACCAALLLPGAAWSAPALGVALALLGAAMGAMDVAMNAQGVELEHRYDTPIMSTFHALFSLGGMSGAAIGGAIASAGIGVIAHFGAVALLLVIVVMWVLPALLSAPVARSATDGRRLRLSPALVGLSVLAVCIMVSEGAMADWSPIYLGSVLGTGPGLAAAGYAVFSAAMTAGRLVGDRLTVRFGRVTLVRAGAVLAAAGLSASLLLESLPAAMLGFLCVGAGYSVIVPLVFSAAGRLDGRSAGPGLAAVTTAGYLGFLAGPAVIGVVAESFSLPIALGLVVALSVAGAALARFVALPATAEAGSNVPRP